MGDGALTGYGGGNPYGDIQLNNSGGDSALNAVSVPSPVIVPGCSSNRAPHCISHRYSGHIYVTRNTITNSFGGIYVYTDTNRFRMTSRTTRPAAPRSARWTRTTIPRTTQRNLTSWSLTPLIVYSGGDSTTCPATRLREHTPSATGTARIPGGEDQAQQFTRQAPSVGMAVYNVKIGAYLGDVARAPPGSLS